MHYYEGHEQAYKQLQENGQHTWDLMCSEKYDFEDFSLKPFLEECLMKCEFSTEIPAALELGCGTGPASCFLAQQGFKMTGVDVSQTAISMAKEQAASRGLNVNYLVADICQDSLGEQLYDLVIDAHCLHCIVYKEERTKAYSAIYAALKAGGYFWIDSMIAYTGMRTREGSLCDNNGVIWSKLSKPGNFHQEKEIDGEWYLPTRIIITDEDQFRQELDAAGFIIEWSGLKAPNDCATYQAICSKPLT